MLSPHEILVEDTFSRQSKPQPSRKTYSNYDILLGSLHNSNERKKQYELPENITFQDDVSNEERKNKYLFD